MLEHVVQTNDKQRFTINETSPRIRANRGHSVDVDLAYELADPPAILLRVTPLSAVAAIREGGLQKNESPSCASSLRQPHCFTRRDSKRDAGPAESTGVSNGPGRICLLCDRQCSVAYVSSRSSGFA